MTFIVIPYGSEINLFGRTIELHVTRMNVGLLYVLALTSVGVYGIVLAGWSSNSKYSLMGGLRSSAQMISYELALGLSIVSVLLYTGTLDLVEIVDAQRGFHGLAWNIFHYPLLILVFVIFYIASLAETNRTPFDLPEADSELVAGYHTEYSSMKFVMFQMAEYLNLITASSIATSLFFGGWNGPFVGRLPLLGPVYFTLKVFGYDLPGNVDSVYGAPIPIRSTDAVWLEVSVAGVDSQHHHFVDSYPVHALATNDGPRKTPLHHLRGNRNRQRVEHTTSTESAV